MDILFIVRSIKRLIKLIIKIYFDFYLTIEFNNVIILMKGDDSNEMNIQIRSLSY